MMKLYYIENNTDIRDVCRMCNKKNQFIIFSGLNRNQKKKYVTQGKKLQGVSENKMKKTESFKFHFHLVLLIGMKIVLFL